MDRETIQQMNAVDKIPNEYTMFKRKGFSKQLTWKKTLWEAILIIAITVGITNVVYLTAFSAASPLHWNWAPVTTHYTKPELKQSYVHK